MHWISTNEWLQRAKGALIQEGFSHTILQTVKSGQVFGLIKKLDKVWEMHVRGFDDRRLEAEIEVSRDYLEHLDDSYRRDATPELGRILDDYQIIYQSAGSPQREVMLYPPKQLTPWKPVVAIIAVVVNLIWFVF